MERLVADAFGAKIAGLDAIAPGLGSRRFYRIRLTSGERECPDTVVARIEFAENPALRPAGVLAEPPLEPLLQFLATRGIPVPACHASGPDILLLEDVGDLSLENATHTLPWPELIDLYREACHWVAVLQRLDGEATQIPAFGRRLDETLFRYKADQFVAWALPWATARSQGRPPRDREIQIVQQAFAWIAQQVATAPVRLAHRDYKAANLHVRAGALPGHRLVMIDLQGAFLAPPEYDLVCLLRDSHVALPETAVQELLAGVRPELPDAPTAETFLRRFTLLTLTRVGKDLSRYLYAASERGDDRYLPLVERACETLRAAAARAAEWHPTLAALESLLPEPTCAR